ncbi:hypothetical protein NBRC116492_08550 [Aurantivibrio infirmus]
MEISKKNGRTVALILVLVGAVVIYLNSSSYRSLMDNIEAQRITAQIDSPETIQEFRSALTGCKFPLWDDFDQPSSNTSSWSGPETRHVTANIANTKYDLIVLPPQETQGAFDRSARLLAANDLAWKIEAQTGLRVLPPELALRMLGDRSWRFKDADVQALAESLDAKVLQQYVSPRSFTVNCHRRNPKISLAVFLTDARGNIEKQGRFDLGPYDPSLSSLGAPDLYLESRAEEVSSEIIANIFDSTIKEPEKQIENNLQEFLPATLSEIQQTDSPLDQAVYLQLFALLTPGILDYERDRLFERSILALKKIDSDSKYYNLLMARALFHLKRRPIARELLLAATSSEELALREYLDGNYTTGLTHLSKIENQLLYILSFIEFSNLGIEYGLGPRKIRSDFMLPTNWAALLYHAGTDDGLWLAQANRYLFPAITGLFPPFDEMIQSEFQKMYIIGGSPKDSEIDKLLFDKIGDHIDGQKISCCMNSRAQIEERDVFVFYENLALANELKLLSKIVNLQASFESAKDYIDERELRLSGHTKFSALKATTLLQLSKLKTGTDRKRLIESGVQLFEFLAKDSKHFDSAGSDLASLKDLLDRLAEGSEKINLNIPSNGILIADFPSDFPGSNLNKSRGCANSWLYSNSSTYCIPTLFRTNGAEAVLSVLEGRYEGNPRKNALKISAYLDTDQREKATELLKNDIANKSTEWSSYQRLAGLLIKDGDFNGAYDVYMQYPPFNYDTGENKVGISHDARSAAWSLYRLGQYQLSYNLYEIALSQNTGSGSEYLAGQRLALRDLDFSSYMAFAYQYGVRYGSPDGYRNYLTALYLVGQHENAEAGFEALNARNIGPQIWSSVFIGQRIRGMSYSEINSWAEIYKNQASGYKNVRTIFTYLFSQAETDREIVSEGETENIIESTMRSKMAMKRANRQGFHFDNIVSQFSFDNVEKVDQASSKNYVDFLARYFRYKIDTDSAMFPSSRGKDIQFLPLDDRFIISYIFMAISREEDIEKLPDILKIISQSHSRFRAFDSNLISAVINAHLKNYDESINNLKLALANLPEDSRPIEDWYQLVEICEWIYNKSGDKRFIDQALIWSKQHQKIIPQSSWAYAFEAKYSVDRESRVRASAFATYLDRHSEWLSDVPEDIRKEGAIWWETHNPFVLKDSSTETNEIGA